MNHRPARRGSILIIVVGLITVMAGLLLSMTALVSANMRMSHHYQADVQYYIHNKNDSPCSYCP